MATLKVFTALTIGLTAVLAFTVGGPQGAAVAADSATSGSHASLATPAAASTADESDPAAAAPKRVVYIAVPHPDDEFEAAAAYSNTPDDYKVFILMTRGESTGYCTDIGIDEAVITGAILPTPFPQGKQTTSCEKARINSWVNYFKDMSAADPTLPGDFGPVFSTSPFARNGVDLAREANVDAGGGKWVDSQAQVWVDKEGRGALVNFDLGDGDLTPAKVAWAITTVMQQRSYLRLNTTLPNDGIYGAFSNAVSGGGCAVYVHPDHLAVADALRTVNFGVHFQSSATCASTDGSTRTIRVPTNVLNAAFPTTGKGVFWKNYGWLSTSPVSRTDQTSMFMGVQSFNVSNQNLPTTRVAGDDRYATAVAVSQAAYPTTAPVVYVASGANFPDALSAAAAAAKQGGPLLLTGGAALPAAVAAEIGRLQPSRVVIVGSEDVVSAGVASQLAALVPDVVRLGGADRYVTSQLVAKYAFAGTQPAAVYLANGSSFADALSATSAAGAAGGPVILTPPYDTKAATVSATVRALAPQKILIVGGSDVVPSGVEAALSRVAPVQRLSGPDRFATNAAVTNYAFPNASTAVAASGLNFPDALGAGAWAGHTHTPLLLTGRNCMPGGAAQSIFTSGVQSLTVVGGADVIGDRVGTGAGC